MSDICISLLSFKESTIERVIGQQWELIPKAADIKAAEKDLEKQSVIAKALRPRVQGVLTGMLRSGTEQAFIGRDGWQVTLPGGPLSLSRCRAKSR